MPPQEQWHRERFIAAAGNSRGGAAGAAAAPSRRSPRRRAGASASQGRPHQRLPMRHSRAAPRTSRPVVAATAPRPAGGGCRPPPRSRSPRCPPPTPHQERAAQRDQNRLQKHVCCCVSWGEQIICKPPLDSVKTGFSRNGATACVRAERCISAPDKRDTA